MRARRALALTRRAERVCVALLASASLTGCSSAGLASTSAYDWTPGRYRMEGAIRYRADTTERSADSRLAAYADVTVGPNGPVEIDTPLGTCVPVDLAPSARDERRNLVAYRCAEVVFELRPQRSRIEGTMSALVTETIRTRGACARYRVDDNGQQVCVQYSYFVQQNPVTKRAALRSRVLGERNRIP